MQTIWLHCNDNVLDINLVKTYIVFRRDIMNPKHIMTNLKSLREQANLSQVELSDKLGLSRQSISKWENGTSIPSVELLYEMSNIYGVSINDIIDIRTDNILISKSILEDGTDYIPCPKCSSRMNVNKYEMIGPDEFDFKRADKKVSSSFNIHFKKFKLNSGNMLQGTLKEVYSCGYCGNILCSFDTSS